MRKSFVQIITIYLLVAACKPTEIPVEFNGDISGIVNDLNGEPIKYGTINKKITISSVFTLFDCLHLDEYLLTAEHKGFEWKTTSFQSALTSIYHLCLKYN